MSRVIKAGQVRFVEEKPKEAPPLEAEAEEGAGAGEPEAAPPPEDAENPAEKKDAEKKDAEKKAAERKAAEDQAESLRRAMEAASREREAEMKAAYNELISAAQDEVSLMMADARAEAQALVQTAQTQSETIRREAFEKGLAEGYAQAESETSEILERAAAEANALTEKTERERIEILDRSEKDIFRLSLDIAEKILKYELDAHQEAYLNILHHAMNQIKNEGHVTLHVNNEEYTRHFEHGGKVKFPTDGGSITASVTIDPSVEPGGCLIETESGVIDAGPAAQLEQIAANLGFE